MLKIVITAPNILPDEGVAIQELLAAGIDRIHIRKPDSSEKEVANLLRQIDPTLYPRLSIHNHLVLQQEFHLGGIHLNSRCPSIPSGLSTDNCMVSRSCHTIEELRMHLPQSDYLFLSPIFDSISKEGYTSAFSHRLLTKAKAEGIINRKVVAMGGITPENTRQIQEWGFGGIAVLGFIWGDYAGHTTIPQIRERVEKWRV